MRTTGSSTIRGRAPSLYDADGSGSADALQFALLTSRPVLTFQDILVV